MVYCLCVLEDYVPFFVMVFEVWFFFFNLKSEGVTRSFHFFAVLQFEIRSSLMLYLGLRVRQLQVMILKIMKIAKMKRKLRTKKRRARTRR